MFYGCEDEDAALKETASRRGYYAIGRFETLRSATLLDLTAIPPIPSLFNLNPTVRKLNHEGSTDPCTRSLSVTVL